LRISDKDRVRPDNGGFTLVELLVVIAIIGVLIALLLPAIQAAREASRNSQCKNNLRQIALGMINYESAKKEFPAGGWGFRWMGDPDAGTGRRQPGGWIFQMAPYLEQISVTRIGGGLKGQAKFDALAKQRSAIISIFYCPTRRPAVGMPSVEVCFNAGNPELEAKSDYAANGGARRIPTAPGPAPNADYTDCLDKFPYCKWDQSDDSIQTFTGIVTARLGAKLRQVTDGASNTLLAGEKYVPVDFYDTISYENKTGANAADDNPGDNSSLYQGYDQDTVRWPSGSIEAGQPGGNLPVSDSEPNGSRAERVQFNKSGGAHRMGGPHATAVNVAYVDGSVHATEFNVGPLVWNALADRQDGGVAP
jgi:prepilin-type N-terminal cleavage/methylation domain-containing protein/prepilin-type processing-associated H-X9-DG protein